MLKKVALAGLITCAISAAIVCGQATPATAPATATAPTTGLKDAYAGKFLIGTCAEYGGYSDAEAANIKLNYNVITPENSMKPQPTHPSEDTYNFTSPDNLVKWCTDNNIKVHGHTLAWHSQTANWFFQPGADGKPVTRELAMERLKKHIQTVVGHYKGKLLSWDVVNEAINDNGDGKTENLRGSQWLRLIGPDFLTLAFKWAHEADPDVQLFYNDYSIDIGAVKNTGKHPSSMLLLKRLIAEGAPITGVGIQGHWHLDTNIPDVEKAIENYESLGLKIAISELDVTATGTNSGAMPGGGRGGGTISPEAFQEQARVYAKLFDIFSRHSKSVTRVTFWGMSDRRSWRSSQLPLLYDGQLNPKPALQAVLDIGLGRTPAVLSAPTSQP
jgi:endo-1,4-beta-xylanase